MIPFAVLFCFSIVNQLILVAYGLNRWLIVCFCIKFHLYGLICFVPMAAILQVCLKLKFAAEQMLS